MVPGSWGGIAYKGVEGWDAIVVVWMHVLLWVSIWWVLVSGWPRYWCVAFAVAAMPGLLWVGLAISMLGFLFDATPVRVRGALMLWWRWGWRAFLHRIVTDRSMRRLVGVFGLQRHVVSTRIGLGSTRRLWTISLA